MSADPFANTTTVKNILQHIISPKIVSDGAGGYTTKTDIVNVDNLIFASSSTTAGTLSNPLTSQSGKVTFASATNTIPVYHSNVTPSSIILTSVITNDQNNQRVVETLAGAGMFTIKLSGITALSSSFTVGWFIASF